MTWWKGWRLRREDAPLSEAQIEDKLRYGEEITLRLAPTLLVRVGLHSGATMILTTENELPDEHARRLLLSSRLAASAPVRRRDRAQQPLGRELEERDPDAHHVPVRLTRREHDYVADVLAAYFRLSDDDEQE